jgi:hypothetical protein
MDVQLALICGLVFLLASSAFQIIGYLKRIPLLQIMAFIGFMVGLVWSFDVMQDNAFFVPMMVGLGNIVLLIYGVWRSWN